MREEMRRDSNVFILGEDIGARGGVFLATDGFVEEFGETRIIDTPLAESSIAGIALGASMHGMRPIAEIEFGDFIWPTKNQIVGEAAKVRYGTEGKLNAPLVIRAPHGGGVRGGLYHSQSVEAFFSHVPGLKVITPSTPYDAKGLLKSAIRDNAPVVFLDISVITYGLMVHHCLEAASILENDGVSVEVLDLRTVRPIDEKSVLETAKKTGKVLIVHEDNKSLGIGAEVAAIISESAFEYLDGPITRLAGPEVPAMPFSPPLEEMFMVNTEKILQAIQQLAGY